eukprot:COSAG01_NODE_6874_length_3460_cov_24.833978_3_plen_68_part_00
MATTKTNMCHNISVSKENTLDCEAAPKCASVQLLACYGRGPTPGSGWWVAGFRSMLGWSGLCLWIVL